MFFFCCMAWLFFFSLVSFYHPKAVKRVSLLQVLLIIFVSSPCYSTNHSLLAFLV